MAQIDATGLSFDYNATSTTSVQYAARSAYDTDYLSWVTDISTADDPKPYFTITALSFEDDIGIAPLSGTIDAITIGNQTNPGLSISGFQASLDAMVDTGDPIRNEEKFWRAVLAGATTILAPTTGSSTFSMMGDFVSVSAGEVLTGARDTFVGSARAATPVTGAVYGDAVNVLPDAMLTGGADRFTGNLGRNIFGEADSNYGILIGGNDTVSYTDTHDTPTQTMYTISGDLFSNAFGANFSGGGDAITVRNFAMINYTVGDSFYNYGTETGGNDTILAETTISGRAYAKIQVLVGDDIVDQTATSVSTGGNDVITLHNVSADTLAGDSSTIYGTVTGGNDVITLQGLDLAAGALDPAIGGISGDVNSSYPSTATGGAITGGNDIISVLNIRFGLIVGDVNYGTATGDFVGGNDRITVIENHAAQQLTGYVYGDAETLSSYNITGGNDTISIDLTGASANSYITGIVGDTDVIGTDGDTIIRNGNDVLNYTTNPSDVTGYYLNGDGGSVTAGGDLSLTDGNDTIIGGSGNDGIYGDTFDFTTGGTLNYTAGNDVLDGRGGNDRLFGGGGIDTAVFGLAQSVIVNLGGIPGSNGSAPYEAIGQGNDQLEGIENVTGSVLADTITGDGGANLLQGVGGADRLDGGSGADTLAGSTGNDTAIGGVGADSLDGGADIDTLDYGRSSAAVIINLATGLASGGDAQGDRFAHFENVTGSKLSDRLTGDGSVNVLTGGAGNDNLDGGAGNDNLIGGDGKDALTGGLGRDIMTGGAAADRFVFTGRTETSPGSNRDIITDLSHAESDRIDLSAIDANNKTSANDAFKFIGTAAFSHHAGELHFVYSGSSTTIVEADIDGNGTADLQIQLTGHITLVSGDFML